ncbi:BCN_G0028290.mRNA.1.CDS.1 [Saccharomyces cerevisiae]|nr:hypothetical protein WN66_03254 [Saccharomyces cerevisiae]CAI4394516.1 BCN_G0028290.mRNA.1.CDS.1 [Saccharomyces cerevisiae]CAI4404123.1 BCE_3a_G0028160.mRNA.1.CDS.1 [Saccharomyces cerevisiae]CAI7093865.1 BCN_G0028290.mRNA.1.CDS.1 [Saccharomyces cerevisiae]CAI7094174.1 BCE_3a_G0028160.mRNA.1.CDS.1 [Saccharomyces cerevisiae]
MDIDMNYRSITTLMSNESANLLIIWENATPDISYLSYTTNPMLGDYVLNVSAINGCTEELIATHLVPTLENATQWVYDAGEYWDNYSFTDESTPLPGLSWPFNE